MSSIKDILEKVRAAKVVVIGDFGLDAYWFLDERVPELSAETGRPIHAVRAQRYGLGGAGNVAANLKALGVSEVRVVGVVGDDPFGREMLHRLRGIGANTDGMITQKDDWQTVVYGKPFRQSVEQDRLDFGHLNRLSQETAGRIVVEFDRALCEASTVICNQQLIDGLLNRETIPEIVKRLQNGAARRFIVDSRHHGRLFDGAILKLNFKEAKGYLAETFLPEGITLDEAVRLAETICLDTRSPVYVTCGKHGLVVFDGSSAVKVPAVRIDGPVDEVGAGDTACAAIAAALDGGFDHHDAAAFANTAAAVTVTKLFQTGTASPEEILGLDSERPS